MLSLWRSAWSSPRTATSCARVSSRCSPRRAAVEVVATCEDLDALLAAVETERPDVVVTDIRMPPTETDEGIRAAAQLRKTRPEVGVVVLSQHDEPAYALALLEQGSERPGLPAQGARPRRGAARRRRRGGGRTADP